jgi:hypothetical protein
LLLLHTEDDWSRRKIMSAPKISGMELLALIFLATGTSDDHFLIFYKYLFYTRHKKIPESVSHSLGDFTTLMRESEESSASTQGWAIAFKNVTASSEQYI